MMSQLFWQYGIFCARYPWEVIFTMVTMTTCLFTVEQRTEAQVARSEAADKYNAANVIIMTVVRCIAILYTYYQLRNLHKLGSKYILLISVFFIAFSTLIFTSTLINFLQTDVTELKDALFFFSLLIDLSKITLLAQFALSSENQTDIKLNIAKGMSVLGPTLTLDMVVETLLLSVGTLSGVRHLEMLSYFACFSVMVNFIVFMTFYPACLYLVMDLSRLGEGKLFVGTFKEDPKMNPVVQRVKIIMSIGLAFVHLHSRWGTRESPTETTFAQRNETAKTDLSTQDHFMKWLTLSSDHIVILILVLALTVKFIFFESDDKLDRSRCDARETSGVAQTQTEVHEDEAKPPRDFDECLRIYRAEGGAALSDREMITLVDKKCVAAHQIETAVGDALRGVKIRRKLLQRVMAIGDLPVDHYDYTKVMNVCCENIVGYVPIPVGVVGPLNVDGKSFHVPMATTEGCLVASTNRGCRALTSVATRVVADGMTRGPVVRFPSIQHASDALHWLQNPTNYATVKTKFDSTSNYARLKSIKTKIAGRYLFVRFVAATGDAMGMNMLSKGTETALGHLKSEFPTMELLSLSGNFCCDKKPAAVNWIEGRGKSVLCEAIVPAHVVSSVLKTSVHALVDVNISKNLIGSAVAGSIGGFNAHAANIVTAIFLATGQDPAQNVTSSNCMTLMEPWGETGDDLYISCTMPSLEVGTVGGGTVLPAQSACLEMLNVRGAHPDNPGQNANQLAKIVCATVLAGELSLLAALVSGDLVKSHLKYNRKK